MGKVVEKKRKKKKGRPSLLDLQKRSLKQQQEQQTQLQKPQLRPHKLQNPSPLRRSTRRNPNPNSDPPTDDEDPAAGSRREKKLKHVLKLREEEDGMPSGEDNSGSDDEGSSGSNPRKRKIDSIAPGSGLDNDDKGENHSAATNQATPQQGSKLVDGPSTPLPDKKLLLFILDRLQKKDTYGVFAEPVDPEELPDYHEVIAHPMDFSTVKKKLGNGAYASLEQFEKDVYLICSNAMQYNSPDTIYFRQARAIQELAKKNFENLRQDSDDNETEREPETEPKVVRRGRPPTKNLKRPPGRPPLEHSKPQLERANSGPSQASLATPGGNTNQSNNDVRKGPLFVERYGSADLFARSGYGLRFGETYIGWSAERYGRTDDMTTLTGSTSKGIMMKHGKKNIVLDENRRNTYRQSCTLASREEPSVLTTFDWERKHLIPVGLHTEYGYARSVARFAAKLGPVAWKVASRKIQRCLPAGVKFGPGWVGENEAPAERQVPQQLPPAATGQPSPPASSAVCGDSSAQAQGRLESNHPSRRQEEQSSKTDIPPTQPKLDEVSNKVISPSANNDESPVSSLPVISDNGGASKVNASEASTSFHPNTSSSILNRSTGPMKAGQPSQFHQNANNHPRINGLNGSYGLSFAAQMGKMIGMRPMTVSRTETQSVGPPSADSNGCEGANLAENSSTVEPSDCLPNARPSQKAGPSPPDLNVGFQAPGSPCSGRADSVQPDLALQL